MGLFDKIRERFAPPGSTPATGSQRRYDAPAGGRQSRDPDEVAVERYRYMLRTAPPETIEQAHAEAFAKLTPEQRRRVLQDIGAELPPGELATSDDPRSLARMATRAEMRNPGMMERTLGRGGGMGMGGVIAGSLLASVAGAFIGTAIADSFFDNEMAGGDLAGGEEMAADEAGVAEDPGGDFGGDFGGGDFGGDF
jgi:hypothetical protein